MYPPVLRKLDWMLETSRSPGFETLAKIPRYSSGTAPDVRRLPFYASFPRHIVAPMKHSFPSIFSYQKIKTSLRLNAKKLKWTELSCFSATDVFRMVFWLVFRQFFWLGFIASFAFPDFYIQWLSEICSSIQRRDRIGIQPISLLGIYCTW